MLCYIRILAIIVYIMSIISIITIIRFSFTFENMVEHRDMDEPFTSLRPGSHARGPVCTL